jgi:hypothetical protein
MHRRLFGRISAAAALVALAVPVSLIAASPSQAASTCTQSWSPNLAGGQSGLTVGCISDVADGNNKISIGDHTNAAWHRGAARTVTGTAASGSTALTVLASTPLSASDVGRPIGGHSGIKGGTFLKAFISATSGTLSAATTAAVPGGTTLKIEHTRSRVLLDAACTLAGTLTSTSAVFAASDVGKSVSGGPFSRGARIAVFGSATSVTVDDNPSVAGNQGPSAICTSPDTITIGAATYSPATSTTAVYTETYHRQIALGSPAVAGTDGGSCAGGVITLIAGGGGTNAGDVGLPVVFKNSTGANADATARKVASVTASTITLTPATCAAGATDAVIGLAGANAPPDGSQMTRLIGQLNLNPSLVATLDDCNKNTYDGFGVVGKWQNPGAYVIPATLGSPLPVSQAQIVFQTSVINFAGYVTNATTNLHTGAAMALHNRFVFPSLPTSLSVCPTGGGTTTSKVAVGLQFDPTVQSATPSVPTGGGNPASPTVRSLGLVTGAQGVLVQLTKTSPLVNTNVTPAACTVLAATAVPTNGCGI